MTYIPTPNNNNSSTGGYLSGNYENDLPTGLSFEEFMQTVVVGITGLPGNLVRTKWQVNPPKQPDVYVNWVSIGLQETDADTFAYNSVDVNGNNQFMRMEALTLQTSFYGPRAYEICRGFRDGLQIQQNLEALSKALVAFVNTDKMVRAPDLVNERWVNRWEMNVYLRREVLRVYPILNLLSVNGTLNSLGGEGVRSVPFKTEAQS